MVMPRLRIDLLGSLGKPGTEAFLLPLFVGAPSCKVKNKSHDDNDCQRWCNSRHGIPPC